MNGQRRKFDIRQALRPVGIVLGVWLALLAGFYFFFVRPLAAEYADLNDRSGPRFQALEERRRQVEEREAFHQALQDADRDLTHLRREVLSTREERYVDVQREVARLCAQFKIDLNSVAYDNDPLIGEELDRDVMVVPLEGNYNSLRNFLQAVEASDRFLVVERVALDEGKEGGTSSLQLNITLATYFDLPEELKLRNREAARRSRAGRR